MKLPLFLALIASSSVFAIVERNVDEKRPIEVVFSSTSHNRISVEGGAVEKVFGDSALFSIVIDSATGNAFVNVTHEIKDPTTLSVVVNSGAIQDLLVQSWDGPSEHVHLRLPADKDSWMLNPETSLAGSVNLLNQILEGSTPPGYGQREWDEKDDLEVPAPLIAVKLKSIEGPFEVISVYEIRNFGKKLAILTPDELKKNRSWVFLNARVLEQDGKAICMIGRLKDG